MVGVKICYFLIIGHNHMGVHTPYYFHQSGCGFLDVSPGKGQGVMILRTTGNAGITVTQIIFCIRFFACPAGQDCSKGKPEGSSLLT